MAYALSQQMRNRLNAAGNYSLAAYSNEREEEEKKKKKNKGGLLSGIGYTLGQLGTGIFGVLEGTYDFVVGGVADLFGAEEFSERLIKDDVTGDWQRGLNEWYNPSKGMQFVGDVASGLGQTVTYVGLNLIPGAGTALSTGAMVAGAGGRGVTAAYQKTGKLGNKEWLYGTGSGLVEMGLEKATGGVGKITKSITKSAGKEVTQTVAKSAVRSGLLKNAFKTGAGEFVEEAASEIIDPYLQRLTIDKNAETASLGEILRAGAVGFVSGAIGSAGGSGIGNAGSVRLGNKIINEENKTFKVGNRVASTGNVDSVLGNAENLLSTIDSKEASDFVAGNLVNLKASYDAYNKLSNKEGIRGKMLLGEIAQNIAYTEVSQGVEVSKMGILDNAEDIAQYLTNKKGEAVTVEDIKNNKDNILTDLAIADFSAKMIVSPEYASEMVSQGKMGVLKMQSQYEAWKNSLTEEQKAKASADLGLDLSTASYKDFNKAMGVLSQNQAVAQEEANARQMQANAIAEQKKKEATPLPQSVSLAEGEAQVYRTQNGDFVGVTRTADGYTVAVESADGSTKQITSKAITEEQVNTLISKINENATATTETQTASATEGGTASVETTQRESLQREGENVATKTEAQKTEQEKSKVKQIQAKARTQELTTKAREIVEGFDNLPANTKARIREMLGTAQSFNVSEENLKFISNFMVKRAVAVSFAEMNDNGLYDTANGKRFIQLNGKNSSEAIRSAAIHEFAHDLRDDSEGYKLLSELAVENLTEEEKQGVKDRYTAYYESKGKELTEDVLNDELTAYALEKSLNDEEFLKKHLNQNTEGFYQKAKGLASRLATWFKNRNNEGYKTYKALADLYDAVLKSPKDMVSKVKEKASLGSSVDSNGKKLTEEQRKFFNDSKVRDKDGNLLAVYHNTNNEFTVFDKDKIGTETGVGMFGKGFYFGNKGTAKGYGKNQIKAYINIKNPYYATENDVGIINTKKLQSEGYDGVIGEGAYKIYVAFEPNQIKLTTNQNPTESEDIRYSLTIDGENTPVDVQESKNLVALHNLSEDNLLRVIELGGFPMPSIAVTTTELPHENYGDITVVFGKETIDPEKDLRNVVYDRDAWTPTTPTVDVKLSNSGVEKIVKDLQSEVESFPAYKRSVYSFFDSKYRDNNGDYIVSETDYTKNAFGDRAIQNSGLIAAYLAKKGISVEPVYSERGFTMGWTSFTRKEAESMLDFVGITKDVTRDNATQKQREEILEKFIEYRAKENLARFRRFSKNSNLTVEDVKERLRKDYDDGNVSQLFFMAEDVFNENRPKDIYDEYATLDKLKESITDKDDFYNWVWTKIKSTFEKKGIDNDSDIFDRYGNRRSFEQRHFAYTAANIVKAMAKGEQEGKTTFGITAGALAAKLSKQFESIDSIREAKKYLALVSEEDLKAFNDKTYQLYNEIVTSIAGQSSDFFRDSSRRDDVGEILCKCAEAKPLTLENITKIFEKETKGYNLGYKFNEDIAKQALTLFQSLKHAPTTYFEAKPRRVVGLKEIKTVLIPAKSSENLKTILDESGISWQTYEGEKTRSKIIETLDNARFSLVDNYTEKQYNDFGWVRANDVISSAAWKNFDSKLMKVSKKRFFPPKTKSGEWIISVSDDSSENKGVENILVFAKGTYQNPKVSQIIKINYNDETRVDIIREAIYERQGIIRKSFINSVCAFYTREDFLRSTNGRKTSRQTISTNRPKTSGSGNVRSNQKNLNKKPIRYAFPDEGGMIVTYSDGTTEERQSLTYATTGKTKIAMDNTLSKEERAQARKLTKRGRAQNLRIAFVNAQAGLEDELKYLGVKNYEAVVQAARSASAKAQQMIGGDIYDITAMHEGKDVELLAKGVEKVMAPIKKAGLENEFFDYLFNLHNIDRVAVDKPVNGNTIEESKKVVADYEKSHPEFKDWLKDWDKMTDAVMTLRVKAGLITQEQADELKKKYKHYVPTYREDGAKQGMAGAKSGKNSVMVSKTIKKATGSTDVLLRPDWIIARQMMEVARAVETNYIANKLYEGYLENGSNSANIEIVSVQKMDKNEAEESIDLENAEKSKPNKNTGVITFYRDGNRIEMKVSKGIFTGFDSFNSGNYFWENNIAARALAKAMKWFKTAVTNLNPFFLFRNAARDLQDAFIYTKNGAGFAKAYPKALKGITTNSKEWQLYLAAGGMNSSIFGDEGFTGKLTERGFETLDLTTEQGVKKGFGLLKKLGLKIETANQFIEQLPRFTEFLASLENGKTVDQALLDSADVTVNFGRSGTVTKVLNRYLIPFFNASVQGASKTFRTFAARKSFKQWASLITRCAILGLVPALINNMLFGDDEEYKNLRTDVKENYFLFKLGDKFIKIPRGRINAIIAGSVIRTDMAIKGEEDAFEGYGENILNTFTPVESAGRTIFSPFNDVKTNTTWYGTDIEGREMENKAIKDRYDETTSDLAIWFGKSKIAQAAGLSPKKIHYLIDQYTGVIGDYVLPATSKETKRSNVLKTFIETSKKQFSVDPVTNNKLSSKFYKIYDETTYKKSAGDENAALQLRYYNKVKDSISTLYKQKDEIQKSNLSDKEKLAQTRLIQVLINEAYQNAIDESGMISEAFALSEELGKNYAVTEITMNNYKSLEESKENVGQYVITNSGLTTGKLYETGEKAAQGLSDMIADYRYVEGLREVYGSEMALKNYNTATYEKAQKLNTAGISYDDYYFAYMTAKQYAGDSEDKREYVLGSIDAMGLDRTQTLMLIYALGYSVKDGEYYGMTSKAAKNKIARHINSLKISTEEKISLAKACGLTVKNGKISVK